MEIVDAFRRFARWRGAGLSRKRQKEGDRSRPFILSMVHLLFADLPDHAGTWNLQKRTILRRADKMGIGADVAHCAVIHDVGTPVRSEPDIQRAVETGSMAGTDECLITGVVAGKILDLQGEWLVALLLSISLVIFHARLLIEIDQLDFVPHFGRWRSRIRWREAEVAL